MLSIRSRRGVETTHCRGGIFTKFVIPLKNLVMSKNLDLLTEQFSRYLTGWAMSKAILEDYCKVISKIEKISEEEIKQRIILRTQEIFDDAKIKYSSLDQEKE